MTKRTFDNDGDLVSKLNRGDNEAFKQLYLKYIDRIYGFVLSICKSPALSQDICHDIFTKVWSNRDEINSKLSFKSFLFTTSRNHVLNIIKRASKEREIYGEIIAHMSVMEHHSIEDQLNYNETKELLNKAVEKLSPQRKKIFELSRSKGLTHDEIAKELGISKGTVNVQLVKALNLIKQYLSEHTHQAPVITLYCLIFS